MKKHKERESHSDAVKRQNVCRKFAVQWIRLNRPDVWKVIKEEAAKRVPHRGGNIDPFIAQISEEGEPK